MRGINLDMDTKTPLYIHLGATNQSTMNSIETLNQESSFVLRSPSILFVNPHSMLMAALWIERTAKGAKEKKLNSLVWQNNTIDFGYITAFPIERGWEVAMVSVDWEELCHDALIGSET